MKIRWYEIVLIIATFGILLIDFFPSEYTTRTIIKDVLAVFVLLLIIFREVKISKGNK